MLERVDVIAAGAVCDGRGAGRRCGEVSGWSPRPWWGTARERSRRPWWLAFGRWKREPSGGARGQLLRRVSGSGGMAVTELAVEAVEVRLKAPEWWGDRWRW